MVAVMGAAAGAAAGVRGSGRRAVRRGRAGARAVGASASAGEAQPGASSPKAGKKTAPIYIGDTPGKGYSVVGYEGRTIQDDPDKYPGKDALGLAGGWAGGEVGLGTFLMEQGQRVKVRSGPFGIPLSRYAQSTGTVEDVKPNGRVAVLLDREFQAGEADRDAGGDSAIPVERRVVVFKISQLDPLVRK